MKLENLVAIVTGSARGIGFEVAKAYAKEGAKVVICDLNKEDCIKACNKIKEELPNAELLPLEVNVTNTEKVNNVVKTTIDKYGKIDILVNNAGITGVSPITELTDEDFYKMIDINAGGVVRFTREVSKIMINQKSGSIINTSSMVGLYGSQMQTAYSASKFAVNGITKACAKELGRYGIRVNAVCPGVVETDMVKDNVNPETKAYLNQMIPLGRTANPSELAGVYVYLASQDANYTNGAIISIDGGLVM